MKTLVVFLWMALQTAVGLNFSKTVHDFGDVSIKDGPLECSFEVTNDTDQDHVILFVSTTCRCTQVTWTKETLHPGGKGIVTAVYSNDEGAYPFDKTLMVYFSEVRKPVVLHMRGVVHNKKIKK